MENSTLSGGITFSPNLTETTQMSPPYFQLLSTASYFIMGFFLTFTGCLSLVGNGFIIYLLVFKLECNQPLLLLIANISIANVLETVFAHTLSTISSFERRWVFGDVGCKWYACVCFTLSLVNMITFLAISVYRYLVVCTPMHVTDLTSNETCKKAITLIWIYCLTWAMMPFLGWGNYGQETFLTSCSIKWQVKDTGERSFVIAVFLSAYLLPVVTMAVMYKKVITKTCSQVSHLPDITHHSETSRAPQRDVRFDITSATHGIQHIVDIELRLRTIITCTMVFFVVAWTPYGVLSMASSFGADISPHVSVLPTMFAKSQSGIFPFLCIIFHDQFRQYFFRKCFE